jgi:chromosome segregation ATPase
MKIKIAIVVLLVACAGLAIALFNSKSQDEQQRKEDAGKISDFSNQLVNVTKNLDDLDQANLALTNNLLASEKQVLEFSNTMVQTSGALAASKASLQTAENKVSSLNARIADLEAQNRALDDRATELTNAILALNVQIADTQRKLAHSETNNGFLQKELQRQIAQRTELERKFNDLNEVRAQVKKLRTAAFVARRLEFMRSGITDQKGAELLEQPRVPAANAASAGSPHYDLNVEVSSDGSVRTIPPITNAEAGGTNAPAR